MRLRPALAVGLAAVLCAAAAPALADDPRGPRERRQELRERYRNAGPEKRQQMREHMRRLPGTYSPRFPLKRNRSRS